MTARFALLLALLLPLAPLTASAAGAPAPAPLVEGEDYAVITDGQPFAPVAGKIEVAEIFAYSCPHCAHFEPILEAWMAKQPKDVSISYVPVAYELDDPFALGFFSLQAMGLTAKTHAATFEAVHGSGNLPRNPSLGELAGFYASLGVNEAKFRATAASPAVAKRVAQARAFAIDSGMEGTPTLVVNGRYLVHADTLEGQLRIAGQLIARERAARR
jgi:thiol:disulfide interchange protein DsbA